MITITISRLLLFSGGGVVYMSGKKAIVFSQRFHILVALGMWTVSVLAFVIDGQWEGRLRQWVTSKSTV
jgi:hypothetical protein